MLANPHNSWYTDGMIIYRDMPAQEGNLDIFSPQRLNSTPIPCRVYQSSKPQMIMTPTASEYKTTDALACPTDVDIQKGDTLEIQRGAIIGKTAMPEYYFAGLPNDYFEPFGGRSPLLRHKEVPIGNDRRTTERPKRLPD